MVASAAVLVLHSALFQLFLREIHSTLSTQTHASTADHAQLSALYQQSLRVESKQENNKNTVLEFTQGTVFFYFHIWRSQMNKEMQSISECTPGLIL